MMIRQVSNQRFRAVQLFQQNDAGKFMRQCLRAEGNQVSGGVKHIPGKAERAAKNETRTTGCVSRKLVKKSGKVTGFHTPPLFVKADDDISFRKSVQNPSPFFLLFLFRRKGRIRIFNHRFLNGTPSAETFHIIVCGITPEDSSRPSHRNNMQWLEVHTERLRQSLQQGKREERS